MKKIWNCILASAFAIGGVTASYSQNTNSSTADQKSHDRIVREVRHQLVMIPQLTIFDNLTYKVDGNNVTLMGQVINPVIKNDAESAVKGIEGVENVNNQIEVLPPSPNDDRIRRQVARAIFNDSSLFRYSMGALPPIRIVVNRGHVSLDGVVNNQADKNVAGIRAKGVPGVFSVENNLQVENSKESKE